MKIVLLAASFHWVWVGLVVSGGGLIVAWLGHYQTRPEQLERTARARQRLFWTDRSEQGFERQWQSVRRAARAMILLGLVIVVIGLALAVANGLL